MALRAIYFQVIIYGDPVYLGILDDYESRHVVAAPVKLNMKYTTLKDQEPLSAGGGAGCIKFIWIGNSKEVIYRLL